MAGGIVSDFGGEGKEYTNVFILEENAQHVLCWGNIVRYLRQMSIRITSVIVGIVQHLLHK